MMSMPLTERSNKLDRLFLASFYGCGLLYKTHPRSLARKFRVARNKRSSLVDLFISDEEKSSITLAYRFEKLAREAKESSFDKKLKVRPYWLRDIHHNDTQLNSK
jgi:hypothetical protein